MPADPILITDSELQGNLKQVYTDIRQSLFPISTVLLAQIKKAGPGGMRSVKWGGKDVFFDVVANPPVNWGASDAGYLPQSSQVTEVQGQVRVKRFYVTREFDNLAIVGTQSKQSAFMSLKAKITEEIDGAMQLGMQEHIHGNAKGIRAICNATGTTTSGVFTSPYGVSGAGQGGLWLYPGMYVVVLNSAGSGSKGKTTITAVSNSGDNVTLTFSPALSSAPVSTDIVVAATASDNAFDQYSNGLINITNRGGAYDSLHGISPTGGSAVPRWNALQYIAGTDTDDATQPSEMDVWKLAAAVGARSGKRALSTPDEFLTITTYGVQQKLIESFLAQRRFNVTGGEELTLNGGYKALKLHNMPVVADEYCPAGTFYMIHKPSLAWVDAADWSPVQYENSGAVRFIDGRDAFQTSFKVYFNLMTFQRNAHGAITGYTDTARFTPVV